jgi:hypothetical protein
MKHSWVKLGALLIAAGGCVNGESDGGGALTSDAVGAEDMPLFCGREASVLFDVKIRDLLLSPVDSSGGISTFRGQYPGDDGEAQTFQCQFDPDGNFISVIPTDQDFDEG